MPVPKTLTVLWLIAVAAMMAATVPATATASPPPFDLSLEKARDDLGHPVFHIIVSNNSINGNPVEAQNVKVKITPLQDPNCPGSNCNVFIHSESSGTFDPATGIWTIPSIQSDYNVEAKFSILRFSLDGFPSYKGLTPLRLKAVIIDSVPSEPLALDWNNSVEQWFIDDGGAFAKFVFSDARVAISRADENVPMPTTVHVSIKSSKGPSFPSVNPEFIADALFEMRVHIGLEGLRIDGEMEATDGTTFNAATGIWNVGTLGIERSRVFLTLPLAVDPASSLEDLPLHERCLTATLVNAYPPFEMDAYRRANDIATKCLIGGPPLLVVSETDDYDGDFILWWMHDCVGSTDIPCGDENDGIKLFARARHNNIPPPGIYWEGDTYIEPGALIFHIRDPEGRQYDSNVHSVTAGSTVSWQTGRQDSGVSYNNDGPRLWYSRQGFNNNIADWRDIVRTVSVSGLGGGDAPGRVKVRHDSSTASAFYDPNPTHTRSPFSLTNPISTNNDYFFEFDALGTYVVDFHVLATRTDGTEYEADGDYIFHLGPIADLEVREGASRLAVEPEERASAIEAINHGPDTAQVTVTVTGLDLGGYVGYAATAGTFDPDTGLWDIGELSENGIAETLVIVTRGQDPSEGLTASIAAPQPYSVAIDGAVHTADYLDPVDWNNTATIPLRERVGPAPDLRDPNTEHPAANVLTWEWSNEEPGWAAAYYEVWASGDGSGGWRLLDGKALDTRYIDLTVAPGAPRHYRVRAVHESGYQSLWSNVVVAGDASGARGVTVAPQSLTVAEDGGRASYTVVLNTQPDNDVRVDISSADAGVARVSPHAVTFTPSTWNNPVRVTVTGVNDHDDNPDDRRGTVIRHSLSGGGYDNVSAPPVVVTVTDDDGPAERPRELAASISRSRLTLAEDGGTDTYTVSLSHAPASPVTLDITAAGPVTVDRSQLVFRTGQTGPLTIRATAEDDDDENPGGQRAATISHTLSGGGYDGVAVPSVAVTVLDDDVPARVAKSAEALTISENGGTGSYTVSLNKRPAGWVTVRLSVAGANPEAVRVTPPALTFTPENWRMPRTVTVVGEDDDAVTGARHATIEHTVTGGGYDGVSLGPVAVTVSDDDAPGITLSETGLTVSETAGLREDTYLLSLSGRPAGQVTVTISSDDEDVAQVSRSRVTFKPSEWNTPHVIVVTAQDDDQDNPDDRRAATIRHAASGGGFDGVARDLGVTVVDNDAVAVRPVTGTDGNILYVKDEGRSGSYTVRLGSRPTHDVAITMVNDNADAFEVDERIVIRPGEWEDGKRVTVRSRSGAEGDASATITHTATSEDPKYDGLAVPNVPVMLVPTPTVRIVALTEKVAGGQQAMFEVRSDREVYDDLAVRVWLGSNYRVLAGEQGQGRTVVIEQGKDSAQFGVRTKNPWTRMDGRPDRPWCRTGNVHAKVSRSADHSPYHYGDEWVWVRVYHSDEFDSCN